MKYKCEECGCSLIEIPRLHERQRHSTYVCCNECCKEKYILYKAIGETRLMKHRLTPKHDEYIQNIFG